MKEPALAAVTRFLDHIPRNADMEVVLLKSHLLVEEAITKLIATSFSNPDYLPDANLRFMQKVALAKAVDKFDHQIWIWGALERLNKARNALAHLLDEKKLIERTTDFVEYVEEKQGAADPAYVGTIGRFGWAAFKVFSVISARANFDPAAFRRKRFGELFIVDHPDPSGLKGLFPEEK